MLLGATHPLVGSPYLSTLDEQQRAIAARVAYRSLCAHGAVSINGGELPDALVTVLEVRENARQVLLVSKSTADVGVLRYYHFGPGEVVIEDVSDDGIHDFTVIREDEVLPELEAFCTVAGSADTPGEPATLAPGSFRVAQSAARGAGIARLDATVWRADSADPGNPPVLGFLLGTAGSWCSQRALQADPRPDAATELRPIAASQVGELIARELLDLPRNDTTVPRSAITRDASEPDPPPRHRRC